MISADEFKAITSLDFEPIKQKLMHRKGGKAWTRERVDAVELEYKRFLYLAKTFRDAPLAPVVDVDEFWHYHILDTKKYAVDCQCIFGYFLHHFPYAGMRGKEDEEALDRVAARTRAMYEETFGIEYVSELAAATVRPQTAFSTAVRLSTAYGAPVSEAAFCYAPEEKAASKAAFCYAPEKSTAQAAFCYVAQTKAVAEPAFCYVAETKQVAETAFCYSPDAKAATGEDNVEEEIRFAPAAHAGGRARGPQERAGFYLDRPRLPTC